MKRIWVMEDDVLWPQFEAVLRGENTLDLPDEEYDDLREVQRRWHEWQDKLYKMLDEKAKAK
jgi:hypothetical protein